MPGSSEGKIRVRITDQAGDKAVNAMLPVDVPVARILPVLISKMQLPTNLGYNLVHSESGKRLAGFDTLFFAGIQEGHTLQLNPAINPAKLVKFDFVDIELEGTSIHETKKALVRLTYSVLDWTLTANLPVDVPMSNLLPALITKMQLPVATYSLVVVESGKRIADDDTLASVGVRDGSIIGLVPDVSAGGGFFVSRYQDIQAILAYLIRAEVIVGDIYAIFLYTSADNAIAEFIRTNFLELHRASGRSLFFFVLEQPKPEFLLAIRQELSNDLGPYSRNFRQVWRRLEDIQFEPVENMETIGFIRDKFNLNWSQLPCIIFFKDFDSKEILAVPFTRLLGCPTNTATDGDLLMMFRGLFDIVERVAWQNIRANYLTALRSEIGDGPVVRPQHNKVYSTIAMTTLTKTIEVTLNTVARLLIGV